MHKSYRKYRFYFFRFTGIIILFLCFQVSPTFSQNVDSTSISKTHLNDSTVKIKSEKKSIIAHDSVKIHSPKKAAWMSAALPGLGQIYNHKYWKLPIIYVGFGVIGYLGYDYYTKFSHYKSSYLVRSNIDVTKTDYFPEISSKDILYQNLTYYRRNFELTCIFGTLFYALNIIDATVDAHLYHFDISENLSMNVKPEVMSLAMYPRDTYGTGLKIQFTF